MTSRHIARMKAFSAFLLLATCLAITMDAAEKKYTKQEIKDLLNRVWQTSELDLDNFRDYVFSEKEQTEYELLDGTTWDTFRMNGMPIPENDHREYVWFVRDGHFVRSMTRLDGVEVSAQQQKASEEQWIKEEQTRTKVKSPFEYFLLSDSAIGRPFRLKQMKDGNYIYKGEITLGKRKFIMLRADYSSSFPCRYTLFIDPEENRLVQVDINLSSGKYSILMGQPLDKIWLPVKCSGSFEWKFDGLPPSSSHGFILPSHFKQRSSREFYSFKKSEVKVKFWFEGVDAN